MVTLVAVPIMAKVLVGVEVGIVVFIRLGALLNQKAKYVINDAQLLSKYRLLYSLGLTLYCILYLKKH